MSASGPHILLLSDFTVQNFAAALRKSIPGCKVTSASFNQLLQVLMDATHEIWKESYDLIIVWASPEAAAPSFPAKASINEVHSFAELVQRSAAVKSNLLMVDFSIDANRFYGFAEETKMERIQEMNLVLRQAFRGNGQQVVSPLPWLLAAGAQAYHSNLWYLSKTPFHISVFKKAAETVRSYWNGWNGKSKKVLLLDLDDTLWGGIVGDDGWQNLQLGGHDGVGEAFAGFQKGLLALAARGVILGIVSKNDEATALEAIRLHPEMLLREHDFAGWKINWNDKAANIAALVQELNLGLDGVVFLDDNPAERDRVRNALPEVTVPDLPQDKMEYPRFLQQLDYFNFPALTSEDRNRNMLYQQEQQRQAVQQQFSSTDEWLASLQTQVQIMPLGTENLVRAAQLLNKTNQMNLRTRRMSETELMEWSRQPGNFFYTVTVSDKFGNAGLTGLLGFSVRDSQAFIEDFVLSCRIMGRKIEETILAYLVQKAGEQGAAMVIAELIPTEKNRPCADFFDRSGWQKNEQTYTHSPRALYPIPGCIQLV